jgi:hypothetical protein
MKALTDEQLHLQWIYNRLVMKYGERPSYDYMVKLQKIIDELPEKKDVFGLTHEQEMQIIKDMLIKTRKDEA